MELGDLPGILITFVIFGVVIGIGLSIQTDVGTTLAECPTGTGFTELTSLCTGNNSDIPIGGNGQPGENYSNNNSIGENYSNVPLNTEWNASGEGMQGTAEIASKLPLIGLVVGFAVLLGILATFLNNKYT